jgi:hypothetical protein
MQDRGHTISTSQTKHNPDAMTSHGEVQVDHTDHSLMDCRNGDLSRCPNSLDEARLCRILNRICCSDDYIISLHKLRKHTRCLRTPAEHINWMLMTTFETTIVLSLMRRSVVSSPATNHPND